MIVDPHPYHSDRPCDNKEKLNIKQKAENDNQEGGEIRLNWNRIHCYIDVTMP